MQVVVYVPAALRQYAGGERKLFVEVDDAAAPSTVEAVFAQLRIKTPGVAERSLDEQGQPRQHVNIFVDGDSIRASAALGLQTPVRAGAEIWILPAVSGG
jgi:molybdopterin synthase sulfur carrier subunit